MKRLSLEEARDGVGGVTEPPLLCQAFTVAKEATHLLTADDSLS